jgi:hypothetical protein
VGVAGLVGVLVAGTIMAVGGTTVGVVIRQRTTPFAPSFIHF